MRDHSPFDGMVLLTFRVGLPASANLIWMIPHRHAHRFFFHGDSIACQIDSSINRLKSKGQSLGNYYENPYMFACGGSSVYS